MKRSTVVRRSLSLLLLAAILTLAGCSSFTTLVRSGMEGVPAWVYEPQVSNSQLAFVGQGVDAGVFNARLLAFEDILSQLSSYIGEDVSERYYRELSTTEAIASLRLRITQEHVKTDGGRNIVHLLAAGDANLLAQARTEAYNAMLDRQERISAILAQADAAYRHNRDFEAISLYADAAVIASEGNVERKDYRFDVLVGKIESFVSALKISVSKVDGTVPTATVTVRRTSRLLPPKVMGASILASFDARNGMGEAYVDRVKFNTASNGSFQFRPTNPGMAGNGEILFTVDVEDAIARLEHAAGSDSVSALKALVEESGERFAYRRVSPVASAGTLVDIMEFTLQGALRDSSIASDRLVVEYGYDGLSLTQVFSQEQEEEDFFSELKRDYPGYRFLIYGRAGVSDVLSMGGGHTALVNGSVALFDLTDGSVVKDTGDIRIVTWNVDTEAAVDEAFRRFGLIASSLLDDKLY
ncbi:MAG: hypothetical protein ACOX6K_00090 [Sphaerochaetaceae bacterium]|jgi:hypothetical protein